MVAKNSTVVLIGRGVAGSTVRIHFHRAGTAATDYSIVCDAALGADGVWTRSYEATVDHRLYVTSMTNGGLDLKAAVRHFRASHSQRTDIRA